MLKFGKSRRCSDSVCQCVLDSVAYDYGGNHLGVDLDPGEYGVSGQVINFGSDEEEKFVLASSVGTFME
nr:SMI1/KNR4 family protein [Pseudomonas sp. R2-60-08W]